MSARQLTTKTTTKDLIIKKAFSFFHKPYFKDFSMSELASKVGISKPAIYRYFINKDAVFIEMENHFFNLLADRLIKIHDAKFDSAFDNSREVFSQLIGFFSSNPQYINYFIYQFSSKPNFGLTLHNELNNRGIKDEFPTHLKSSDALYQFFHMTYCSASILFFIKIRERTLKNLKLKTDPNEFSAKLINFINSGLKGCTKKGDILCPVDISQERKKELQKLCSIDPKSISQEDKFFTAFANTIKKYGNNGVTVEKIATELNMAKSSLYFYFENKNSLIKKLIDKEFSLLDAYCNENFAEAKNFSEYIYILLITEFEFFKLRPSILHICGWVLQSSTTNFLQFNELYEAKNFWEAKLDRPVKQIDLGFPIMPEILTFWMGVIPVAITMVSSKYEIEKTNHIKILNYIFDFIQNGVEK